MRVTMNKIIRVSILFVSWLLFSMSLFGEVSQYRGLIKELMENDKNFQSMALELEIQKKQWDASLQTWDLSIDLQSTQNFSGNEDRNGSAAVTADNPDTGTDVSAIYESYPQTSNLKSATGIEFGQDLWKNSFGSTVRRQNLLVSSQKSLAYLSTQETLENYLESSVLKIIDIIEAQTNVEVASQNLQRAKKLERNIKDRFRSGVALESDFLKAQVSRMQLEDELRQYQVDLDKAMTTIKYKLASTTKINFALKAPQRVTAQQAPEHLRKIKIIGIERQVAESEVALAADDLDPTLKATLGFKSRKYTASLNQGESLNQDDYYYVGAQLSLPVRNSSKRMSLAQKKLEMKKYTVDIDILRLDLMDNLSQLEKDMAFYRGLLKTHQKKMDLQQKIYQEDLKRFNNGLLTLADVITSQDSLGQMKHHNSQYMIQLERSHIRWLSMNDQLLSKFKDF